MKILLLSDVNCIHTQRWAVGLAEQGCEISVFSLTYSTHAWYDEYDKITYHSYHGFSMSYATQKTTAKLGYLKAIRPLRRLIKEFQPDIIHAHYATSYGFIGSICKGNRPLFISIWGEDVTDFPYEGPIQRWLFKYNLKKAQIIFATSHFLASETYVFTDKPIHVVPFGVDIKLFHPKAKVNKNEMVVGIVKTLEPGYAIDMVIESFAKVRFRNPSLNLKLIISGTGTQKKRLKTLVKELNIDGDTTFTGYVDNFKVPDILHQLDVFCCFSKRVESFGVAVVEAMACELPVIVTDVGGLPEVVKDKECGMVIPSQNIEAAANAIEELLLDEEKRKRYGDAGRKRVLTHYRWKDAIEATIKCYAEYS